MNTTEKQEQWKKDYRDKYEGSNVWSAKAIDSQIEDIEELLASQRESMRKGFEEATDFLEEANKLLDESFKVPNGEYDEIIQGIKREQGRFLVKQAFARLKPNYSTPESEEA